jgi:uncharacterized protein
MDQRLVRRGAARLRPVVAATGVFEGYASLFNRRDGTGDIVMPGAFTATLRKRPPFDVRMLFQHDPAEPVGTWIDMRERQHGLYVRGRLDMNVQRGRELASLIESGGIDGLSIGFRTVMAWNDRIARARRLVEIDLWEISLVTFPMLEGARIAASPKPADAKRAFADGFFTKAPSSMERQNGFQHTA